MAAADSPEGIRKRDRALYGFGYTHLALLAGLTGTWLVQYYRPNPDKPGAVVLVSAGGFMAAMLVKSIVDAVADPLVGFYSDRTSTRWGRRKPFIAIGGPLLTLLAVLVWFPPYAGEAAINTVYLMVTAATLFFFFTIVACPYLAMLPEISTDKTERVRLTAWQGGFNVLGTLLALGLAPVLIDAVGHKAMILWLAPLILLSAWSPLLVREGKAESPSARIDFRAAVVATLRNPLFVPYVISQVLFWEALWIVLATFPKLLDARTELPGSLQGAVMSASMITAVIFFPLFPKLTARFGKKRLLGAGMVYFGLLMVPAMFMGRMPLPLSAAAQAVLVMVLAGPAVAALFSLPNAMLSDIVDLDEKRTGEQRAAMYFGIQGLIVKAGSGIGPGIAVFLMGMFGETQDDQGGFFASLIAAVICAVLAALVLTRYKGD